MRTTVTAAASLALCLAATLAFVPRPALAHDKLGANLNFIGDFRRNHEFADVVKQSRRFLKLGTFDDQDAANLAPIGADGWPTTDFRVLAMAAQQDTAGLAGTYKIVFNGSATLSTGGEGTIQSAVFDAATNTTRADLVFPAGAQNMIVDFTGTGGAVKNLRIVRPGVDPDNPPLLTDAWKNFTKRFPVVRFLDWTRTNGNRHVAWADRTTPEKLKTEAYIAQWETVIDAANVLGRDPWINVPVQAGDEYVTNLATLLRDRLATGLNVYVEYGNELWNFNIRDTDMDAINGGFFNGATVNRDLAAASPPGSPLRFDGESDASTLGFRRVALRLKEISDIFKTVWGASAINTRVRPVLAGQMANSFIVSEGLRVIDEGLGIRPDTVFYAISGAPYVFPAAIPDGNADETPGLTKQQILDGLALGVANASSESAYQYLTHAGLAAWYGLKVVAYEAGFDNFGSQNVAAKAEANRDPQIRELCKSLVNQWHAFGFEHILWFNAGADSYDTQFGMWPLVEDLARQATPKNQCMDDILAAPLPAITVGAPVLGSAIAGGSYRGGANPTGPVTGIDGPFGFPGFVEYLLRADDAGTYQLVFTGSAPAGESFRLKLNNATVAANVTLPTSAGASAAIAVTLRKGLNALRIERAVGASFSITSFSFTLVGDTTPDAFSFAPKTGVATGSTVVSDPATINGLTAAATVTVSGGEYSVGCGGTFTGAAGTIANGQTVCVRHVAAATAGAVTTTVLTVGGVSAAFTSTTTAATPGTLSANPASPDFGGQSMGTTSPAVAVTLANTGGSSLTVSSVSTSTDFAVSHDCASLAAGASCTASVTFTPTAQGSLNGTLTVQSSAGTLLVPLAGTGERSLVAHYYRSILRRAPDAGGKGFWESEAARLASLGANVNETWYAMAVFFFNSPEYLGLARDDAGFVADLFNTFFNRPPDPSGLAFWTGQLAAGMPREVVLVSFMLSPEFVSFAEGIFGSTAARREVDTVGDFYRGLLSRLPDEAGFNFWVTQFRAAQCQNAGAVYAQVESISASFFYGGEYAARNRSNAQYVGDLYNAFLRRGGDLTGVLFWIGQLDDGTMTREFVRQQFIASGEFQSRVNAIIAQGCLP